MDSRLYNAIKSENLDFIKKLIASDDGIVLQMTPLGNTSVHVAVQLRRSIAILEEICNKCPPSFLMQQNTKGDTPLHIAARLGAHRVVGFLIARAKVIHQKEEHERGGKELEEISVFGVEGCSSSLTTVQQLVRMPNKRNDTALHDAVMYERFEVAKLLTEADPDFEYFANNACETPLYLAVKNQSYKFVDQILKTCPTTAHGAPGGRTALHAAALYCKNDSSIIKLLVDKKPGILQEVDLHGHGALHYAVYSNNLPAVKQLLDNADQTIAIIRDKDGMTVLHHMATLTESSHGVIKEVIETCSEDCWELVDNKGQNFLHVAAENGRSDVINCVLDTKSKMVANLISKRDNYGNTPLQSARKFDREDCSLILAWDDRVPFINASFHDEFANYDVALLKMRTQRENSEKLRSSQPDMEKKIREEKRRIQEEISKNRELMQSIGQTHMVVATLIATVAFAASFTLPGGYHSDGPHKGMATLVHQPIFVLFIISNSLAMLLSTLAVFIHFWSKSFDNRDNVDEFMYLVRIKLGCTFFAIVAMVVAFLSGTNTVISHSPKLAMTVFVLGWCFVLFSIILVKKILRWKGLYEHLGYLPASKLITPPVSKVSTDISPKSIN